MHAVLYLSKKCDESAIGMLLNKLFGETCKRFSENIAGSIGFHCFLAAAPESLTIRFVLLVCTVPP